MFSKFYARPRNRDAHTEREFHASEGFTADIRRAPIRTLTDDEYGKICMLDAMDKTSQGNVYAPFGEMYVRVHSGVNYELYFLSEEDHGKPKSRKPY